MEKTLIMGRIKIIKGVAVVLALVAYSSQSYAAKPSGELNCSSNKNKNNILCLDTDGDGLINKDDLDDDNDGFSDQEEINAGTDPLDPQSFPNNAPQAEYLSISSFDYAPVSFALSGKDLDGHKLTYSVTTNPTKGNLSGEAPNLTYTPSGELGNDSFEFLVNDGFVNSAPAVVDIAIIDRFPVLSITQPTENASYDTSTVLLKAEAIDAVDGNISSLVSWSSNIDGALGAGGEIVVNLSSGTHLINAIVKDSQNQESSDSVSIMVDQFAAPTKIESFYAESSIILSGQSTEIFWEVNNADQLRIIYPTGSFSTQSTSSSYTFSPSSDTTYVIEAYRNSVLLDTKSLFVSVIQNESEAPIQIISPALNDNVNSDLFQIIGQVNDDSFLTSYLKEEACVVGNQFVFSNVASPEANFGSGVFELKSTNPSLQVYRKSLTVNRMNGAYPSTFISPSATCLNGPGQIEFEVNGATKPVNSIDFDVNADGTIEDTVSNGELFSHTFDSVGVYLVKAVINFTDSSTYELKVVIGVQPKDVIPAYYNAAWSNFLSLLEQEDYSAALRYFYEPVRGKYKDLLNSLSSGNISQRVSGLESVTNSSGYREFAFLHVKDNEPQLHMILFEAGEIVGL